MYENNDEAIESEAKKLLEEGIYTDTEQAYLEAKKIVNHSREQAKKRQFKLRVKSIKKQISKGCDYTNIPYSNKNKYRGDKL